MKFVKIIYLLLIFYAYVVVSKSSENLSENLTSICQEVKNTRQHLNVNSFFDEIKSDPESSVLFVFDILNDHKFLKLATSLMESKTNFICEMYQLHHNFPKFLTPKSGLKMRNHGD